MRTPTEDISLRLLVPMVAGFSPSKKDRGGGIWATLLHIETVRSSCPMTFHNALSVFLRKRTGEIYRIRN